MNMFSRRLPNGSNPLEAFLNAKKHVGPERVQPLFQSADTLRKWNGLALATITLCMLAIAVLRVSVDAAEPTGPTTLRRAIEQSQEKVVKIYGAGGFAGLEAYQSGCLISADGHILTTWSTVLDSDEIVVISTQGVRSIATVVGVDPRLEIAILKVDGSGLPHFDLSQIREATPGERMLAVSNLFGIATGAERPSVLKGNLLVKSSLESRKGNYQSIYRGPIYVIDAMTANPGSGGGALTDWSGNLVGLIGKELRDPQTNIWLNYAIPISELRGSIDAILNGKAPASTTESEILPENPHQIEELGFVLVPDVLSKTPAFVDRVEPGSPAHKANLQADDLIIMVDQQRVDSQASLRTLLRKIDKADPLLLLIKRGNDIVAVTLSSR